VSDQLVIAFKTFLHTPDAENLFLARLEAATMRHPAIVVVDLGVWGARGKQMATPLTSTVMTVHAEVEYYVGWVHASFPEAVIIWVIGGEPGGTLEVELIQNQSNAVIFSKAALLKRTPKEMVCGHGCGGPVLRVQAQMLEALSRVGCAPQNLSLSRR
jgi:hypothetical protein